MCHVSETISLFFFHRFFYPTYTCMYVEHAHLHTCSGFECPTQGCPALFVMHMLCSPLIHSHTHTHTHTHTHSHTHTHTTPHTHTHTHTHTHSRPTSYDLSLKVPVRHLATSDSRSVFHTPLPQGRAKRSAEEVAAQFSTRQFGVRVEK